MQLTGHTSTQSEQYMQRESSITNPTAKGLALPEPSASRLVCSMEIQWSGQIRMHCKHAMQRSMSTVSIPRLRSGSGRLYSGYWRVIFLPKRCPRVTPIPFKIPCPSCGILYESSLKPLQHQHRSRDDEQPDKASRHEYLPPQVHQLVHPQTGHAPPYPLERKREKGRLQAEPDPVEGAEIQKVERRLPAAQKERHVHRRHQAHRGELGGLDQGPRHPRVLDHVAADYLALPLRQVKRHPLHLREPRDVEHHEHRQQRQKVPAPETTTLGVHHVHQREAPGEHDDAEQAQDERHL